MQPFTIQTILIILFIIIIYLLGKTVTFTNIPLLSIIIKSTIISIIYGVYLLIMKPSKEILNLLKALKNRC